MIAVCGEALVDLVPDPSTAEGELGPLHPRLGGGPYNAAIALGRLGVPVNFQTRLSTDRFGDTLLDRLREAGVDTDAVQRGAEPTALAVVGFGAGGSARYSFHTAGTAGRFFTDPGPLPEEITAVSFGTLSMVLEPGATAYESVLFRQARSGALVVLDPNIRADLIDDAEAYRARFGTWLGGVGLLKLSAEDAAWLARQPGEADPAELIGALRRWQQAGPAAVVLTRGAEGMTVLTGAGELVEVPGVDAPVVDTIGAGDTVQAALLAWLYRHDALSEAAVRALDRGQWELALRFAASAAAVTVSRPGAQPPCADELD
ncbi:fructokinase [Halopolyspora algeriensis]|uniref:Fructokinase n=1 Tax=Halopolyspora algeriensis TaxID=1500506 RepID=A0A368VQ66_9ACTN|nr:carbohydrate kinase [Halopolyspora algeriensis]RCW43638.1 fructokinase [Halopolyspora algeriensis]TQM47579.1 fructokinase [Halopolyspora algeriensis]